MDNNNQSGELQVSSTSEPGPALGPSFGQPESTGISKTKTFFQKPLFYIIGAVLILLLIFFVSKVFYKPPTPAGFVLKAVTQDAAGIDSHTVFTLQSTQSLSSGQIQKILKFDPPIDFSVKQVANAIPFINKVFAGDNQGGSFVYQLQPKEELKAGVVYAAAIKDQSYANREYGWAFQVKASFQVVKTHPGNKTTYVPTNTGIELTFNRLNIQNVDKYFEITPSVPGHFETYDDTAVFLPNNPLAEHTVYTVSIKKGLQGQGSSDSLRNDYEFSFETQSGSYQTGSYFNFTRDFVESPPGIKIDLSIYSNNVNNSSLSASVYRISNPSDFLSSYQNSRNWAWGWANYYRQNNSTAFDTANKQPVLTFQPSVVTQNYQSYIEIPQTLDSGMYVIDVTWNGQHLQAWLQVTPIAHYFSITHDTSLLWLYDFGNKMPLKNAQVEFTQTGASQQILGSSDQNGLSQFNTPDTLKAENSDKNPNPTFFKVTDQSGNIAFVKIQDQWGYNGAGASSGDNYWKFLSTDRYTYQMTDTVKFWGVVKSRKTNVRQKKVTVALYDSSRFWDYSAPFSQQQPVASTDVLVSPFNTIEGSISFKGLDPKTYSLVVMFGNETVSQSSIEVLTYSKPSYQLSVDTSKPAIFAGDSVIFTVKGAFFDGTPLTNTQVNYSGYWNNSISGQVTLDNNGEGSVILTPEYNNNLNSYYPRDLSVTFTPASSEEGQIAATGDVLVFGPHMYLQAGQEKQSGDSYTFKVKLNNIDINNQVPVDNGGFRTEYISGPVVSYGLSAKIIKTTYTPTETGTYYDPINKTVSKTYQYVRSDQDIETLNGNTDNNGEWSFARNLPKADNTYYQVTFTATDRQGRSQTANAYAYYASYDAWQPAGLTLSIGSDSYEKQFSVDDQITLTAQGDGNLKIDNQPILYYRYQNNITKAVVVNNTTYTENFGNDFLPSVQYRAVTLSPYGFAESNSVFADFKKDDNSIKINISTDKDSYRPGDKINVKFHVTDKNSRPIAAETNVAIVDEAVFHVLPYAWQQQILDSLYQPVYTTPISGATAYLLPQNGGGAEGGCFTAGTQILLSSGKTKGIEDVKVGDQVLTFENTTNRKLALAIVQGVSSHVVDDFLVINNKLQVTPEHKIFLNGDWNFAGNARVGDTLELVSGQPQIIRSITQNQAPHTMVYNIVVGKYHTYFANGYFVHNAEKGGASVRDNFVDTAAFQTLRSDNSGDAQLDFTAPDNITSWRITARSFDAKSLKAGEQTKLVPTTLPLFINSVLNGTYLVGDSPQIKIGLYGTGYHADQDAQVNVVSDGLRLNQNLTIKNHVAFVTLNNLPEGQYDITISAKQGNLQDALKKHLTVVKSYFAKPTASTQTLKNGPANIPGNTNGYTTLEFMDTGKGKFYQDLLLISYNSGIRADQVAGSFFAKKLLNDYFNQNQQQDVLDLSPYQAGSGGVRLFPYSDPDLELSAKMADLAQSYVFDNGLNNYFTAALHDNKTDLHREAVALYGLASLQKPVLTRLMDLESERELSWQDKIYVALGLAKLGATEESRNLYAQAIRPHLHVDGPQAWYEEVSDMTSRVKLTDLTADLAAYLNLADDENILWNYMDSHSPAKDLDTLEKLMYIKSAIVQASQNEAKFSYQTSAKKQDATLKNGDTYSMTLSDDELKSISFNNVFGSIQVISFYEQSQDPVSLNKNINLSITRQYTVNGKVTANFHDGDVVRVKLFPKIGQAALNGDYQIVDYLPSGLKPIADPYTLGIDQGAGCLWYPQKIINNKLYFTVPKDFSGYYGCEPAIQYLARVVTKGEFTANPSLIQSALNQEDLNISESSKVSVN